MLSENCSFFQEGYYPGQRREGRKDLTFKRVLEWLYCKFSEKVVESRAAAPPTIPVDAEFGYFCVLSAGGDG